MGQIERLAKALEDMLARRRDINVAIASGKHAGRYAGRVVVAGLARHVFRDKPTRRLEIQKRDLCPKQRRLDPLTLAGNFAFQQSDQNSHSAENPGAEIRNWNTDAHRTLARKTGYRHQPAHALGDLVKTRTLAIGSVLTEAGNGPIDDALVDRTNALVVDPEAKFYVRPVVLDNNVGGFNHPLEDCDAVWFLQIEREAPLVAMKVLEIRSMPRPAHIAFVETSGKFDLDDIGAPVGKLPCCRRSRPHPREIEHFETGERLRGRGEGHAITPIRSIQVDQDSDDRRHLTRFKL